ncbi:MAG: hypothetical protein GWP91_19500 [Rhodobacterales bacterium]|nr:hypothetical protein [Rhodobacterales bacterium]
MSDLISAGGSLSLVVLGLGAVAAVAALAMGGMAFTKRRIPLAAWVLLPMLTVIVGALGAWQASAEVYTSIAAAEPAMIGQTAMDGLNGVLAIDTLSRWVAAFVFALCTWAASAGAFAAGDDTERTMGSGGLAALVTGVGAIVVGVVGARAGVGADATILAGLMVFAGFGVSFGSFKRALDEQGPRVAGMRFVSSVCMLLAVSYGSKALVMSSRLSALGHDGVAAQSADLLSAIALWGEVAAPVATLGWIAMVIAVVVAFFGFFSELGEVVERYTLLDVFATLAIMSLVGGSRLIEMTRTSGLEAIGNYAPAVALFTEMGGDLHSALLTVDGKPVAVTPNKGGFGDVLVYTDEAWTRQYAWNGAGWDKVDTPLAEVNDLNALRPLLVMGGSADANEAITALEMTPDGHALLMLRASEVKGDVDVPAELAYLQFTFMELQLGTERDLKTEVWTPAGDNNFKWGPVYWFGETEAEEQVELAASVSEATEATGLHLVIGERSRMKDIANGCLAWTSSVVDGKLEGNENWCHFTNDDAVEVRDEAAALWDVPAPENTRMTVTKVEGDQVEEAVVVDYLIREVGAIDHCLTVARDEGEEETTGKMMIDLGVTSKGKIQVDLNEKSRLKTAVVARCVALRFKDVVIPWPEDWEAPEVEEGEERPPMPTYEVVLDLKE